ncbi:MAG TPA: hypothetical protein VGV57_09390, partial [Thermoleophilaceae bacterium]|nr:hypothetical protein [Thermoleophilaceae bacterium]
MRGRLAATKAAWVIVALCALAFALAGCGGEQSALEPRSEPARRIETLWWVMFWIAFAVFAGAIGLLGLAWLRRDRGGLPLVGRLGFDPEGPGSKQERL